MLRIQMNSFMNSYRPYNLSGTAMPSADKAEWLISSCLAMPLTEGERYFKKAGSSGYLGPGDAMRILE